MANHQLDYIFRCSHCIKLIAPEEPVYREHDFSYCGDLCRRSGPSVLHSKLRDLQLEQWHGDRSIPQDCSPAVYGLRSSCSESSAASSAMRRAEHMGPVRRIFGKVVHRVLDAVSSRLPYQSRLRDIASFGLLEHVLSSVSLRSVASSVQQDSGLCKTNCASSLRSSLSGHSTSTIGFFDRNTT
eukprot:TRINITY_DN81039_c0_g1_i1.p1 TRINITY_DN81039_c0_g1~~TRINITY_DN81039_c0_g1_i1.p1  ORF type:complete len:206 (+),score=20.30 TRINITY_DN81039_c0_g1_i1:67-618(+)